jgi:hypothetical protein
MMIRFPAPARLARIGLPGHPARSSEQLTGGACHEMGNTAGD